MLELSHRNLDTSTSAPGRETQSARGVVFDARVLQQYSIDRNIGILSPGIVRRS